MKTTPEKVQAALDAAGVTLDPEPRRIIITVSGGVVTAVHSTNPELTVSVLDYDNMETAKDEAGTAPSDAHTLEYYKELEAAIGGMTEVY